MRLMQLRVKRRGQSWETEGLQGVSLSAASSNPTAGMQPGNATRKRDAPNQVRRAA